MVVFLVGFDGGKRETIQLVEKAAAYPGKAQSEAQFTLVLLHNREREFGAAQPILIDLKRRYPRNRLVSLESASTRPRAKRAIKAENALAVGFSKLAQDNRARMDGEKAVWYLKRGAIRVASGRPASAVPDLIAVRDETTTAWVKEHAHLELGKAADLGGDRVRARVEYDQARKLCARAKHKKCVEIAKDLKKNSYSVNE